MESQVLPVLPKSDMKEEIVYSTTSTTLVEESAENHESMEIQGMSVSDVTHLMAEGDPVSFVIVTQGEDGLEWIEDTEVVLESEDMVGHGESERVIVLEASTSSVPLSELPETACIKLESDESSADTEEGGMRKRSHSGDLSGQPVSKVMRVSPPDDKINEAGQESQTPKHHKTWVHHHIAEGGKIRVMGYLFDKSDKKTYQTKLPNCVCSQESSQFVVVKEDSSVINAFGYSHSSSSLCEGSISDNDIRKEPSSFDNSASEHQQINIVTPLEMTEDAVQMTQIFASRDSPKDTQAIRISSPGANVELAANSNTVQSLQEETKSLKECQRVIRVSGEGINTRLEEGGVVYRCGECDYASTNKHYYKQHVDLVHNTARPFKCPYCDYAGKRGHALREHLIVHSAQRPYSCMHCNATFRKKGHLTNHTKLHAASASTVCATGLPGGLPSASGQVKVVTAADSYVRPLVKVPVGMDGRSPVITVKAEPSGRVTTVHKAQPPPDPAKMAKRSKLWCALCDKDLADVALFQAHLRAVHGTDRLFACDRCAYVTANKEAIMGHLALHIPSTTTTPDTQPTPPTLPSTNPAKGPTPLYTCTHCGFATPDMKVFVIHATSHKTIPEEEGSVRASSKALSKMSQPQQPQMSKVICSECGHVADNTESMHAHLWTHINADTAAEQKNKPPTQLSQEQRLVVESSLPPAADQRSSSCPIGLKTLPENAAFKCTECSYVSRDASQFVKHMLVHKTQQNQAPRIQVESSNSRPGSVVGNVSSLNKAGHSYKVKPITTENTCRNSESSPFVHDPSRGRFYCTICPYSCEYQRTIKAHIWKHSGHQQIDYPIFQNGPLSMYEDPITSGQPVVAPGNTSATQSPAGTVVIHASSSQPAVSQPVSLSTETCHAVTPTSTLAKTTAAPLCAASASGSGPMSVKFITVSGSQVLHSSGPLPTGSVKLIPMQPSPAKKPALCPTDSGKHVVVHVQGTPLPFESVSREEVVLSKPPTVKQLILMKKNASGVPTKISDLPQKVASQCQDADSSVSVVSRGRDDREFKPQPGASPETQASTKATKAIVLAESKPALVNTAAGSDARADGARLAVAVVSHEEGATRTTGANVQVPATPVTSIISAKHTLPACASVDKQHMRVAVPASSPSENAPSTVSGVSEVGTEVSTPSAVDVQSSNSESHSAVSTPVPSKDILHRASTKTNTLVANHAGSGNSMETCLKYKASTAADDASSQRDMIIRLKKSASGEQSVVVEAVDTVLPPGSYTGLCNQQASLHVSRSTNHSPVPSTDDLQKSAPPQGKADSGQAEVSSRVLRSSKRRANAENKKVEDATHAVETAALLVTGKRVQKSGCSHVGEKLRDGQTLQDSESAVTLLSLQNRDPSAPLSHPSVSSQGRQADNRPEHSLPQESPDRSPSSSSETDSVAREIMAKGVSEDLMCGAESTSGKNRGSGGICSTLLAVIEQLRERSRSESDTEDKQSQPPVKKRAGRRRGRRGSEEEVLEIGDSDNIEQLSGDDGISYRCKLCHYTSPRVPLIRLHMRTHRQKEPFECSLCSVLAESSEALQRHMLQHCKVRTYTCKFCPQSFNHKSTLRAHMRAHNDSEPFLCDICEFESTNPLEYRAHMQKHTGSALLCCPNCPAVVASRQDLRVHQAGNCPAASTSPTPAAEQEKTDRDSSEEAPHEEKILCPKCEFTSNDRSRMEDHIASHMSASGMGAEGSGEGLLHCASCDFTAVSSRSLKSHMKRHANDQRYVQQPLEQYKCLLCGYVCHHLPSLKSHMWRHASDENYSYQFTNDVINAAIDYDTRSDPPSQPSRMAGATSKEPDEPELLDKVLSAERRILEGQMSRQGGSEPVCWVTFRCCQCGFQTINKPKLNVHMRTHADIIQQTLQVSSPSAVQKEAAPTSASSAPSDSVNIKVVYGPV